MTHPEYEKARSITFDVAADSAPIERRDAVVLAGDRTVRLGGETDGESAIGIAGTDPVDGIVSGTRVTVYLDGGRNAKATNAVSAGDSLVCSGDEPGALRPADGSAGEAPAHGNFSALAGMDESGRALVRL